MALTLDVGHFDASQSDGGRTECLEIQHRPHPPCDAAMILPGSLGKVLALTDMDRLHCSAGLILKEVVGVAASEQFATEPTRYEVNATAAYTDQSAQIAWQYRPLTTRPHRRMKKGGGNIPPPLP